MIVRPPQGRILPLMWTLALLTTAENATPEAVVDVAAQHMRTHTPSEAGEDREFVEERVYPTPAVIQTVEHLFQPFAGKIIPMNVINELHFIKHLDSGMQNYDGLSMVDAIDKLIEEVENIKDLFRSTRVLIWFGTKSPEDQKVAIDLLVQRLKKDPLTLSTIIANGKELNGLYYHLAEAVEMKWWMSLPTDEMYMKLGLSPTDDHKVFVLQVGHLIWEKFKELGENEFSTFMLTKMLERSQNEIMWARIIYDELIKDGTGFPLSSIFDGLIRTKDKGAVGCRPSDAVIFLTSTEFSRMYAAKISRKEAGKMVMKKLLERSKDELMWAKLVYMLKFHEKKPDVFNSVFQSYHADSHTAEFYSPSAAVQDLMKLLDSEQDRKPPSTADDTFLKLRRKSDDEVMWAKLLYILQHYNQASKIVSSRLETIFRSWTKKPEDSVQFSKRLDWRENILKSSQFANLYVYAYFSSDNPSLFLLERLRKLSLVEARWARALNKLRKDESQQVSFSSVLDALLHSWIAQPYFAAAENKSILVDAFDFLLEKLHALSSHQPSPDKLANLVSELLTKSENQYMWAALLYKLQQDQASDENLSKIFDVLLQNHQLDIANVFEIKPIIQRLENLSLEPPISISDPAILHLVLHRVLSLKSDDFMWAKVLYILQNVESKEFKSFFSYLLKTLILKWTTESGVEISLSSENIAKLRTYASCSGDDPDLFLLNALRDLFHDDVKLAHFINEERKKNPDLIGVLSALFCSWIGLSYNASTSIEIQRLLVRVYMYLSDKDGIASLRIASFKANQDVGEIILDHLLKESADKVMWAKFLEKLQDDASMHDIVSSVRRSLWNINEWSLTEI